MAIPFEDRADAGRQLAAKLSQYADRSDIVVLALPRGGVPVGYEVAHALRVPLDVFLVRKLGLPGHEELAMGAIASGGVRVLNHDVLYAYGVTPAAVEEVAKRELRELERREREYREGRPKPDVHGHTMILVDDGLATGSTMRAAVTALRRQGAAKIVVAVPVASPTACEELAQEADEIVCAVTPRYFQAVGEWYFDFSQTADQEVRDLLARAEREWHVAPVR